MASFFRWLVPCLSAAMLGRIVAYLQPSVVAAFTSRQQKASRETAGWILLLCFEFSGPAKKPSRPSPGRIVPDQFCSERPARSAYLPAGRLGTPDGGSHWSRSP